MSAPGNTVILLVLVGLFMGCAGYALGRLHERRMSGEEREEAYRDGYDHAARRVFSMAARVAGPRRRGAVRASAVVGEEGARSGESEPVEEVSAPMPAASAPAPASPSAPAPGSAAAGPVGMPPGFGFPAPAPHVVPGLPVPAAEGGVSYSSLPDPQWSAESTPLPASSPQSAVPASDGGASVPQPRARHSAEPERGGRHTVPDELVQAATYKLAADRVARAKVRRPEDPADPPVPRPRGQ
ncbi:hypothetical protein [Actinoplanes sp. HUAS TT8]|uniref:hypothetical protein n=1 Tax=Actinoplanes sp. HUAS TT8 TaxID=3447453 RepID=UPI003F523AFC